MKLTPRQKREAREIAQQEARRALGLLASEFARVAPPGLSRDLWDATVNDLPVRGRRVHVSAPTIGLSDARAVSELCAKRREMGLRWCDTCHSDCVPVHRDMCGWCENRRLTLARGIG